MYRMLLDAAGSCCYRQAVKGHFLRYVCLVLFLTPLLISTACARTVEWEGFYGDETILVSAFRSADNQNDFCTSVHGGIFKAEIVHEDANHLYLRLPGEVPDADLLHGATHVLMVGGEEIHLGFEMYGRSSFARLPAPPTDTALARLRMSPDVEDDAEAAVCAGFAGEVTSMTQAPWSCWRDIDGHLQCFGRIGLREWMADSPSHLRLAADGDNDTKLHSIPVESRCEKERSRCSGPMQCVRPMVASTCTDNFSWSFVADTPVALTVSASYGGLFDATGTVWHRDDSGEKIATQCSAAGSAHFEVIQEIHSPQTCAAAPFGWSYYTTKPGIYDNDPF
jgi:hypothetical protein